MHGTRTLCVIVGLTAIAACSRQQTGPCEPDARYSKASSAPPVQIPDDLSPPDESDAIRLPTDVAAVASITAGVCLEKAPPFSGNSRPFLAEPEESRKSRREARREAKRAERGETSAAPSEAAPASQSPASPPTQADPPPAGDDRVIGN
jgi:hypothetical protein